LTKVLEHRAQLIAGGALGIEPERGLDREPGVLDAGLQRGDVVGVERRGRAVAGDRDHALHRLAGRKRQDREPAQPEPVDVRMIRVRQHPACVRGAVERVDRGISDRRDHRERGAAGIGAMPRDRGRRKRSRQQHDRAAVAQGRRQRQRELVEDLAHAGADLE
jgi:hypothetical protein